MEKAAADKTPFLAVVWFHAPHEDIEAGPDYLKMYDEDDRARAVEISHSVIEKHKNGTWPHNKPKKRENKS